MLSSVAVHQAMKFCFKSCKYRRMAGRNVSKNFANLRFFDVFYRFLAFFEVFLLAVFDRFWVKALLDGFYFFYSSLVSSCRKFCKQPDFDYLAQGL